MTSQTAHSNNNTPSRYILFDISNLLYRTFFANKSEDDTTIGGLAHHMALTTLNKYYKAFSPDKCIMVFDRSSWRKEYTSSDLCISKKPYKGNRRQKMTKKEKEKYERFMSHLSEFEDIMREHTSVVCLAGNKLEADDLIAVFVQIHPNDEIIIISGDGDMIQLLDHNNIQLINPATGKQKTLDEWNGDKNLFMFEKCLRGDMGDNVQSAYPRIRKTRIKKAYQDPFERVSLMNEFWTDIHGNEFLVKHLFQENELLMDLTKQPEPIRKLAKSTIEEEMKKSKKYSHFHFLRFCGKYQLKKLSEQIELFVPMLSS